MSTQSVVETKDLTKKYNGTTAVNGLNLRIEEGEIFGFLGPNGAGKTTTILMLLGLTEPTSGEAYICGYNTTREPLKVKRIVGYVPEKVGFYEDLTARSNLAYTARLNGLQDDTIEKKIGEAIDVMGLSEVAEHNVGTFSRGMKQRLAIADILFKTPKIAILDEPTAGIDPEGIKEMLDLIAKIAREQNMTVIMSSHQLHQIQQICSRVGIMAKGQLVAEGSVEQLGREALAGGRYIIEIQLAETTQALIDSIKQIQGILGVDKSGDLLLINCSEDLRPQIAKTIVDNNGLLVQMRIKSYALEDIYMKYFTED